MKSIICLILTISTQVFAQESQITAPDTTLVTEAQETDSKTILHGFGLSLNTFPFPLLSEGIGGALDFQIGKGVSIALIAERESNNALDGYSKDTVDTLFTNKMVLIKYQLSSQNEKDGLYISAGYKWSVIETSWRPLFGISFANKEEKAEGAVVGLGYRIMLSQKKNFQFHCDIGANYEPGSVKKASLHNDIWVTEDQFIKTKLGYGLFPEVRITATFQ